MRMKPCSVQVGALSDALVLPTSAHTHIEYVREACFTTAEYGLPFFLVGFYTRKQGQQVARYTRTPQADKLLFYCFVEIDFTHKGVLEGVGYAVEFIVVINGNEQFIAVFVDLNL